jgi:CheY-like chemotaxis protein
VATQHRSRRARALRRERMNSADAAAELTGVPEEETPEPLEIESEPPPARLLVSAALRRRGWSVREGADGAMALTVAPEALEAVVADYAAPSVLSPSAARKARSIRIVRSAFARGSVEELVSAGSSGRD